jgi:hypothetical protein
MLTLPFPERSAEIKRFVRKHHYTRRCPGVWTVAYAITNSNDKIQAVLMYGPAPYPSVARAFCRRAADEPRHIWQHRMVGRGISEGQLDHLIEYANADLAKRGYWWVHTLTDPVEKVVTGGLLRLETRGFTGEVYHRTGATFLGGAGSRRIEGYLIDGKPVHIRQGAVTLSLSNVRDMFPDARSIRVIRGNAKQRWAYVLGNSRERAERTLLMKYQPQAWEPIRQPRLLHRHRRLITVA